MRTELRDVSRYLAWRPAKLTMDQKQKRKGNKLYDHKHISSLSAFHTICQHYVSKSEFIPKSVPGNKAMKRGTSNIRAIEESPGLTAAGRCLTWPMLSSSSSLSQSSVVDGSYKISKSESSMRACLEFARDKSRQIAILTAFNASEEWP